jgi:hypothetical protein
VAPDDDTDDRKVKDLLTPETRAELERWFGLPSYTELEERGIEVEDPDAVAAREQRAKAMAAVDPALLDHIEALTYPAEKLLGFTANLALHVEGEILRFDEAMVSRVALIAEPREVDIPDELHSDLQNCTPQALLRDLHRAELFFEKRFEIEEADEQPVVDGSKLVAEAMAARFEAHLESPFLTAHRDILASRADRQRPWAPWLADSKLPNRRWETDQ